MTGAVHDAFGNSPDKQDDPHQPLLPKQPLLPIEVEIYINPDGSVTFADLEASLVPIAEKLESGSSTLASGSPKDPDVSSLPEADSGVG